jgi:hypothetical protein
MRSWNTRAFAAAALALLVLPGVACQPRAPGSDAATGAPAPADSATTSATDQSLSLVIARNATTLMSIPGVVGVYEGETGGKPVLRVMVLSRADSTISRIPKTLEGYDVEIEVGGPIKPMNH